jgi:hypothetical protein
MLASVIGVLWLVIRTYRFTGFSVGPRHIQFVSVCLIIPTILILGLERVLTHETSATLIGGLAGYLLSNIGKYEPSPSPKQGGESRTDNQTGTTNDDSSGSASGSQRKTGLGDKVY